MSWEDPIVALAADCQSILAAEAAVVGGEVATHGYGMRDLKALTKPPRYVWVPTRAKENKMAVSRQVLEVPQIMTFRQNLELHCWAKTYSQCWALVTNAIWAADKSARADIRFENGRWAHPSEAWNQLGELYILELSLLVPVVDAYVNLGTLPDLASEQILPVAYQGLTYNTDDLDVDGEPGPIISTL